MERRKLPADPTREVYAALTRAFDHFNETLFFGKLPHVLITLHREKRAYGTFLHNGFGDRSEADRFVSEITLNPATFKDRSVREIMSTLVHEMTHLQQYHQGKPGKGKYHNKEWAGLMKDIGLHPSHTGTPGGRETGTRVSHYIIEDGLFALAWTVLEEEGFQFRYFDVWTEAGKAKKPRQKRARYICPCCDIKVTGAPGLSLECRTCYEELTSNV